MQEIVRLIAKYTATVAEAIRVFRKCLTNNLESNYYKYI